MLHMYIMEYYYSAIEKKERIPLEATWMDLEIIILNEVSQTEKDKYLVILLYAESKKKKKDTNEIIYKTERLTDLENELMVARGKAQLGSLAWTCTQCYI